MRHGAWDDLLRLQERTTYTAAREKERRTRWGLRRGSMPDRICTCPCQRGWGGTLAWRFIEIARAAARSSRGRALDQSSPMRYTPPPRVLGHAAARLCLPRRVGSRARARHARAALQRSAADCSAARRTCSAAQLSWAFGCSATCLSSSCPWHPRFWLYSPPPLPPRTALLTGPCLSS